MTFLEPSDIVDHGCRSGFDAAMIAINRLVPADRRIPEAVSFLFGREHLDILAQGSLIALERETFPDCP